MVWKEDCFSIFYIGQKNFSYEIFSKVVAKFFRRILYFQNHPYV